MGEVEWLFNIYIWRIERRRFLSTFYVTKCTQCTVSESSGPNLDAGISYSVIHLASACVLSISEAWSFHCLNVILC